MNHQEILAGKTKFKDYKHKPVIETNDKLAYLNEKSVKYNHGEVKYEVLPNGFYIVMKKDLL